jgi:hypothetical protein
MAEQSDTALPIAPAQGTIRLTIQGNAFTSGPFTPVVQVSGYRVNSRFGTMDIPVWAGWNRVDVHAKWWRDYGQAHLDVAVGPGAVVPVFYAVPHNVFITGSIGHEPQPRKGLGATIAIGIGIFVTFFAALAAFLILLVWLAQR